MAIARLDTGATAKGGQTRARILEAALFLFKEVGYEQTTMRAVAREAAVALGNTYYYFESKEHLLLAFYERIHEEHLAACRDILASERDLKKRLVGVIRVDRVNPRERDEPAAVIPVPVLAMLDSRHVVIDPRRVPHRRLKNTTRRSASERFPTSSTKASSS